MISLAQSSIDIDTNRTLLSAAVVGDDPGQVPTAGLRAEQDGGVPRGGVQPHTHRHLDQERLRHQGSQYSGTPTSRVKCIDPCQSLQRTSFLLQFQSFIS